MGLRTQKRHDERFFYDWHDVYNCDLQKRSLMVNFVMRDYYTIKTRPLSVLFELRSQVQYNLDNAE